MNKKKSFRAFLACLLAGVTCGMAVACGSKDADVVDEDAFTGFLKGYLVDLKIGNTFYVKDYVDVVNDSEYTIVLAKKDGSWSEDITSSRVLETLGLAPGEYTITYTVLGGENEGTYVANFNLVVPQLQVGYNLKAENMEALLGSTLVFEEYLSTVEWDIQSYYDYTIRPDYVWIGEDGEEDLSGKTSFTFTEDKQHAFHFTVITEDEQTYPVMIPIDVVKVADSAKAFMSENNVVAYKYNEIDEDMGVHFKAGFSRAGNRQDVGYFAFKGNYGVGNYVKVDFTGNNLPKVAFFANQVVGKLSDGSKGVYVANGHYTDRKSWQNDKNAFTVYGPNKVKENNFSTSASDVLWKESDAAIAGIKLEVSPDVKYTYYVGVKEAKDASQVSEGETPYMILEALLINRETQEIVYQCQQKIESTSFNAGYFSGNIILYANFGYETKFDKVYALQQATSIAQFLPNTQGE